MKLLFVHNEVENINAADDADVLVQLASARSAAEELGHETDTFAVTMNLSEFESKITEFKPDLVFNLVEAISSVEAYMHFIPQILERRQIKYTGCPTDALYLTTNKVMSKKIMKFADIPTPEWFTEKDKQEKKIIKDKIFIIKPVSADASVGLDDSSIIKMNEHINNELAERSKKYGECFAEEFIDGREFNISILEIAGEPVVLAPAEMIFSNYPENKFKLLGYEAKWSEDSFEYKNTSRKFEYSDSDFELIETLKHISVKCFKVFSLKGYARVDFRVSNSGEIFVLEINANPCISPDAGFTAACTHAGIDYKSMIEFIIKSAE